MAIIRVARLAYNQPIIVGILSDGGDSFAYDDDYLRRSDAVPLSLSLPLRSAPFPEIEHRPYFEGLLAEGMARRALAEELQIAEDDYLSLLVQCGRDCIGDVLILGEEEEPALEPFSYEPLEREGLMGIFRGFPESAAENAASRLSLAGTQNKVGLAHNPDVPIEHEWLRPHGLAATTHILKTSHLRDLPEIEYLCMHAAAACGIVVARTHLLDMPIPVLAVERFDRQIDMINGTLRVRRLHQEDLTQAFALTPGSKYAELPGGSVPTIANLIKRNSALPAHDLEQFARTLLFCYAIGNCDAHLKNYSITLSASKHGKPLLALAPMYDLVSTTRYPNFSRNLAMKIGGAQTIDDVTPGSLATLAHDLGIAQSALRRFARDIVNNLIGAINSVGKGGEGPVLASTPYIGDDLIEEAVPRIEVLERFCEQ